jgi:hypothetical protein
LVNYQGGELTIRDYAINTFQAILKGVPFVGGSLEHFIFGPLAEIRMRRIERTLDELSAHYGPTADPKLLAKEEFVNLLEATIPALSRATNEDKRLRFRDLLINAAKLPSGSEQWEEARFASDLLQSIEPPGLAILAAMAECQTTYPLTLASVPVPQVYEGKDFNYDKPQGPQHALPYEWTIVEEWVHRLREMRLIHFNSVSARGGFGGASLAELGRFLIRWAKAER